MSILLKENSLWLDLFLVLIIAAFIVLLPLADRRICRRIGLSLTHGVGSQCNTEKQAHIRQIILYFILVCYLAINVWLVFFSRSTNPDYEIRIAPLYELSNSLKFQSSLAEFFSSIIIGDLAGALAQISLVNPQEIAQTAANFLLYIPLGYLLPYIFRWFRKNKVRPTLTCFVCSAVTENLQLIFRCGVYDFDDLFFNTLGGFAGVLLFCAFAYKNTNPDWQRQRKKTRQYRKRAKETALYRYSRKLDCGRVTVLATIEEDIYSFFVEKLGFRLVGQHVSLDSDDSTVVLELGGLCVEFRCSNHSEHLQKQTIMMSCVNLDKIRHRLEKCGINVDSYEPDPYTNHRSITVVGPDNIHLEFCEY